MLYCFILSLVLVGPGEWNSGKEKAVSLETVTKGTEALAVLPETDVSNDTLTNNVASDKQVIEDYVGSKRFTTANVVAKVEVRIRNHGMALACPVLFYANGKASSLYNAPMGTWSEWIPVLNHIGKVDVKLENKVKGNCKISSQVRYYKEAK
ncbi:MAG: hypothetical protein AAF487_11905 [Bacteroidota bacterium]